MKKPATLARVELTSGGAAPERSPPRKRWVGVQIRPRAPEGRQSTIPCHMSHSYSTVLIHLVFSTKGRRRLIKPEIEPRLWAYIVGIGRNHSIMVHAVGGIEDHLHVLYDLPPTISRADSIRAIKANSSRWMTQFSPHFAWQKGSGSFSVSVSNKAAVMRYIGSQREHHKKISFEDEFIALLKKHGITYDPKYVFD
jgi:putative transposase